MSRRYYLADLEKADYTNAGMDRLDVSDDPPARANVVGSLVQGSDMHMPVIDIDFSAELLPSTTNGHFHLYLNKEIEWGKYIAVLEAMADAGLVEPGFVNASIERGQTFVRLPHVKKGGS